MSSVETPYRFEAADGYSVLVLQPELNDSQWADFEKVGNDLLGRLRATKSPAVMVDLTPLSYMGSAMVALIVRLWKTVKEQNGRMVVVNRHEMVFEVLRLAGLHNVWTIVETRESGLRQLGRKESAVSGGSNSLVLMGAIGAIGALVGVGLIYSGAELGSPKVPLGITLACSVLGIIAGAMTASRAQGSTKTMGVGIIAASAIALVLGFLLQDGGPRTPAVQNNGTSQTANGGGSEGASGAAGAASTSNKPAGDAKKKRRDKEDDPATTAADSAADKAQPADKGADVAPAGAGTLKKIKLSGKDN